MLKPAAQKSGYFSKKNKMADGCGGFEINYLSLGRVGMDLKKIRAIISILLGLIQDNVHVYTNM